MPESKKRPHPLVVARIAVQLLFLAFFLGLLLWTVRGTAVSAHPWIARLFLISDPLILVGAALAGAFTTALLAALAVVGLALLAPRAYCGWICPLGTLQDVADKLLFRRRDRSANSAPRLRQVKYGLLAAVLVLAVFGLGVYGWFDPISIMTRSFGTALVPIAQDAGKTALVAAEKAETPGAAGAYDWARAHRLISDDANFKEGGRWAATRWGWTFVVLLLGILLAQAYQKRFWCRNLCPLGALLGLLGSASPLRPRVASACVRCNQCREQCKMGAFEPDAEGTAYRSIVQECILCYACERSMCPVGAIHIGAGRPAPVQPAAGVIPSRRAFLGSAAVGAVLGPGLLLDRRSREKEESNPMLRPPGALKPDGDFQAACVRCGACMRVCPTNALHPSGIENGIAGLWTPTFVFNIGYCDYTCNVQAGEAGPSASPGETAEAGGDPAPPGHSPATPGRSPANLCATVCPTGAIAPLARAEKNEWRIGTAVFDHDRCLPWARGEECLTCEEMCPVTPRAISHRTIEVTNNDWLALPQDRRNRYEQLEAKRAADLSAEALAKAEGLTPAEEEELDAMPPKMRLLALPYVLRERCIGCGVCENVCPVDGRSGIRVERLQTGAAPESGRGRGQGSGLRLRRGGGGGK